MENTRREFMKVAATIAAAAPSAHLAAAAFRAVLLKVVEKRFPAVAGDLGRQTHVGEIHEVVAVAAPGETVGRAAFEIAGESFLRDRADRQETDGVGLVGQLFTHGVDVACATKMTSN